ncbi:FGGY-family carbohydrate kinase [Bacteroidota bacterium]
MQEKYIISHDMGTSSDKAALFTTTGEIIDIARREYPLFHPHPNHAEQDPQQLWKAVCETTKEVITKTKINAKDVIGMTFSSQTANLLCIDKEGKLLRPSMSWLDGRAADIIRNQLWTPPRFEGYNIFKLIKFLWINSGAPSHTGKDQVGKLLWLKLHEPELYKKVYKFIDLKDYILYRLTGNLVTSVDIAWIWFILDTRKKKYKWSKALCKYAGITPDKLVDVKESAEIIGEVTEQAAKETGLLPGTPIINGCGDLSAAAIGSGALEDNELHISLGTSGWVAGHFKKKKIDLVHYAGCIGSAYPKEYFLGMAHQETAGICLEWLKNKILYHKDMLTEEWHKTDIYQILDELAEQTRPGAEGLMFTPWMYGERTPINDDFVRAGLFNISLNHERQHLVRAVFEGIAFNTRWAMETLENMYKPVEHLNIVGGGAKSDIWCQIFSDILNRVICRVKDPQQAGARGMALLASMTLGQIGSYSEIKEHIKIDKRFYPNPDNVILYEDLFKKFKDIYKYNKKWYAKMNNHLA